jgi:hypothetical protein
MATTDPDSAALPPKVTSFGAHPGYKCTPHQKSRSPEEGRRPESGTTVAYGYD